MPIWNVVNKFGAVVGQVEGLTKEEVQRFVREQMGAYDVDLQRPVVKPPTGDREGKPLGRWPWQR